MRMQLELRNTLQVAVLVMAGMAFAAALGRLPLVFFDTRTLLFLIAGLLPLPFLRGSGLVRYLGPSIAFAGAVGLVVLLGNWAKCGTDNLGCVHYENHRVSVAAVFYGVLAITGLAIIRHIPKKEPPA
jgi:hypothetical protein